MEIIRWLVARLVLLYDRVTQPDWPQLAPEAQAELDRATEHLALYQFEACPFCVKTRHAMRRLGLNIELRDARRNERHRKQLLTEGGKLQAPCLRIEEPDGSVRWLYESDDIIDYLERRFGVPVQEPNT
jgi:glutaredoxin